VRGLDDLVAVFLQDRRAKRQAAAGHDGHDERAVQRDEVASRRAPALGPYYHWAPELGLTLEVHKDTEFIRNTHVALRQAARDWDGKDPLRPIPAA
jgi:hypothetical protein